MPGSGPIIPVGIRGVVRLHSGLNIWTVPQSNVMLYLNTLILQLPYMIIRCMVDGVFALVVYCGHGDVLALPNRDNNQKPAWRPQDALP
jgi:hypothetical protein